MTLTQIKSVAGYPVEGNRSKAYIGIGLLFNQQFFPSTSDCRTKYRADPRFRVLDRARHEKMRNDLASMAAKFGLSDAQARNEWERLIESATAIATDKFKELVKPEWLNFSGVPFNKSSEEAVRKSIQFGLSWIYSEIHMREMDAASWINKPEIMLNMRLATVHRWVYVKMQRHHSMERPGFKAYKIGVSTKPDKRDNQHRTSNTDLVDICRIPEDGVVTEKAIHRLIGPPMDGTTEWFLLSQEQVETLQCSYQLKNAILNAMEARS